MSRIRHLAPLIAVLAVLLLPALAQAARTKTWQHPTFDFGPTEAFSWKESESSMALQQQDPELDAELRSVVQSSLGAKGLSPAVRVAGADLLLRYSIERETREHRETDRTIRPRDRFGDSGLTFQYDETQLNLRVFAAEDGKLIWEGQTSVRLEVGRRASPKLLQKTVGRLLKAYPSKR